MKKQPLPLRDTGVKLGSMKFIRTTASDKKLKLFLFTLFLVIFSQEILAGSGGDAFSDVWDTLKEWTQGTLGRIIAGAMVLVGIVGGIARQSLMAFALGIGGGMGLYNTPTVVESVMSATLPLDLEIDTQTTLLFLSYLS